jgi:hypothetical protein
MPDLVTKSLTDDGRRAGCAPLVDEAACVAATRLYHPQGIRIGSKLTPPPRVAAGPAVRSSAEEE